MKPSPDHAGGPRKAITHVSTSFAGVAYQSFIDTGSNGLFFNPPSSSQLPKLPLSGYGLVLPFLAASSSASNSSYLADSAVSFQIGSFLGFARSSNRASAEIGGNAIPSGGFDWGLPFFFGRNV